jgi:hypothetical protein
VKGSTLQGRYVRIAAESRDDNQLTVIELSFQFLISVLLETNLQVDDMVRRGIANALPLARYAMMLLDIVIRSTAERCSVCGDEQAADDQHAAGSKGIHLENKLEEDSQVLGIDL